MVKYLVIISLFCCFASCQKANERACIKSYGDSSEIEIPIDSVSKFLLYKNLTYHIYQDTLRKVIIKGGSNVVTLVDVVNENNELSIKNSNKCNFLRDFDKQITVEIHYPFYSRIYSETEDSLLFKDTIHSNYLYIEQVLAGGHVDLNMVGGTLVMIASNGVGNYTVSGEVNHADLRIQSGASGNALDLKSPYFEIDQNSTGNLFVNLDSAEAVVIIKGTGNVIYTGEPDSVAITKIGVGELIKE